MTNLNKPISFETTFNNYEASEFIGEGGAGRVYGGVDIEGSTVAIKVLAEDRATTDKRKRFQNEVAFLARNKHANIVSVIDNGVIRGGAVTGPFYVMPRYQGSLRDLIRKGISPASLLPLFIQILDGVEAAHLQGVLHRDLKPENILHNCDANNVAIADFGIARFTETLATTVETDPGQRLCNFQYAAPEQRTPGKSISAATDVFALGLILNEMFTGEVPQGTDYRTIAAVASDLAFLDEIVAKMLKQAPEDRPQSIDVVKGLIERYKDEAVSRQRLSEIEGTVIKSIEVDEPLAKTPPRLIGFDWKDGLLTLRLDRDVTPAWIDALNNMERYTSTAEKPPRAFSFRGDKATVDAPEHQVQLIIDYFKTWLPIATQALNNRLQQSANRAATARREQLHRERAAEEQRLRILRNTKI